MPAVFDRAKLATVQFVPPSPMSSDTERLLPELLEQLLRRMINAGARVLLPAAGTGEFHSLSAEEVIECVRVTCDVADSDCTVVAPVGLSLQHAIRIGQASAELGAAALLVMPPVHPYVGDEGFADYLRAIADATSLPLLTYKRSAAPSDGLLLKLAEEGYLAGVKYAVNDVDAVTRFVQATDGRLAVYCGTAERYAPFFMLAGAEGYTSGAGCVCPRLTLALHAALAGHDYLTAMDLLRVIRPIEDYRARQADALNITLVKFAVELTGLPFGPPRPPQARLSAEDQRAFQRLLEPILQWEAEAAAKAMVGSVDAS
jgi:4-hydroxy-tetrahydrodipicolinate synthase